MKYHDYLKSPEWAAKRQWALERAGHHCQVCRAGDDLDVHHNTYETLGREEPGDLVVLCRECHGLFHGKESTDDETESPQSQVISKMGAERTLLLFLLGGRADIDWISERIDADEFRDPSYRAIYSALLADHELDHPPQGMDPVAARHFDELRDDPEMVNHVNQLCQGVMAVVADFGKEKLERKAREIRERLNAETDNDRKAELVRELEELSRKRAEAKP